jgi:hypothetical protein
MTFRVGCDIPNPAYERIVAESLRFSPCDASSR